VRLAFASIGFEGIADAEESGDAGLVRATQALPIDVERAGDNLDVDRHLERPCILSDLSAGGAKLSNVRGNTIPDEFRLRTPNGDRRTCHVVWRTANELGVRFTDRNEGGLSRKEKEFADR
jgi:hypothetical protein